MTMTVTAVTESVTSVTVVVTITSRCCNTSHSYRRNHHIAYSPRIRHVFAGLPYSTHSWIHRVFTAYSPRRITESARTKRELTARCGTASPGAFPSVLIRTCSPRLHPPPPHTSSAHLPRLPHMPPTTLLSSASMRLRQYRRRTAGNPGLA